MRNNPYFYPLTTDLPPLSSLRIKDLFISNKEVLCFWYKYNDGNYIYVEGKKITSSLFIIPANKRVEIRDNYGRTSTIAYYYANYFSTPHDFDEDEEEEEEEEEEYEKIHLEFDGTLKISSSSWHSYILSCYKDSGVAVYDKQRILIDDNGRQDFKAIESPGLYACVVSERNQQIFSNILIFNVSKRLAKEKINLKELFLVNEIISHNNKIIVNIQIEPIKIENDNNFIFMAILSKESECVQQMFFNRDYPIKTSNSKNVDNCQNPTYFYLLEVTERNIFTITFEELAKNTEYKLKLTYLNATDNFFLDEEIASIVFGEMNLWTVGDNSTFLQIQQVGSTFIVFNTTSFNNSEENTFLVTFKSSQQTSEFTLELTFHSQQTIHNITILQPNERYNITWSYKYGANWIQSNEVYNILTKAAPPSPPQSVQYQMSDNDTVLLEWKPPEESNGLLVNYDVQCFNSKSKMFSIPVNVTNYNFQIESGTIYYCVVIAKNIVGSSYPSVPIEIMHSDILRPTVDGLSLYEMSDTQLQLSWNVPNNPRQQSSILAYMVMIGQLPDICNSVYVLLANDSVSRKLFDIVSVQENVTLEMSNKQCSNKSTISLPIENKENKIIFTIDKLNLIDNEYLVSVYPITIHGLGRETNYPIDFHYPKINWQFVEMTENHVAFYVYRSNFEKEIFLSLMQNGSEIQSQRWKKSFVNFNHLEANKNYEFGWRLQINGRKFKFNKLENFTFSAFPASPPRHFTINRMNDSKFQLHWQEPQQMNGHFKGYNVQCAGHGYNHSFHTNKTFYQMHMTSDAWFECFVMAINDFGYGEPSATIGYGKCVENISDSWTIENHEALKNDEENTLELKGQFPSSNLCPNPIGFITFIMQNSSEINCLMTMLTMYYGKVEESHFDKMESLIKQAVDNSPYKCSLEITKTFYIFENDTQFVVEFMNSNGTKIENIFIQLFTLNSVGLSDFITISPKIVNSIKPFKYSFIIAFLICVICILLCATVVAILFKQQVPAVVNVLRYLRFQGESRMTIVREL